MNPSSISQVLSPYRDNILQDLETLVHINSFSQSGPGLVKTGEAICEIGAKMGLDFFRIPVSTGPEGAFHVIFDPETPSTRPFYGIVGHYDTVHTPDSPFRKMEVKPEEDRIYGPGVLDMKAGIITAIYALGLLRKEAGMHELPFQVIFNCDEEIGSPDSREVITQKLKGAASAFVMEGGKFDVPCVITGRKGILMGKMEVSGIAAHAGENPESGANAIVEAALKIDRLHRLNNPETGTVVTVGKISGGLAANQIPEHCSVDVDVRVKSAAEEKKIRSEIGNIMESTHIKGTRTRYELDLARPPFEANKGSKELLDLYVKTCAGLGIVPKIISTGGGSDANLIAAMGVPTLDGIGPTGTGPHTDLEYIVLSHLWKSVETFTLFLFNLIQKQGGKIG